MSASRGCLVFTNLMTFLTSLLIMGAALLIRIYAQTNCSSYVQGPILVIGMLLLLVSLVGMVGSCCRLTYLLWLYLVVLVLFIIGLLCITLVAVTVLHLPGDEDELGEGSSPLQQYSHFLRDNLVDEYHWLGIKGCLLETNICSAPETSWTTSHVLSPVQVGCCNPPGYCGPELAGAKSRMANTKDDDCRAWSSDPKTLCYDCDSCKAGFLERIKSEWMKITTVSNFLTASLVLNFLIGCYVLRGCLAADHTYTGSS